MERIAEALESRGSSKGTGTSTLAHDYTPEFEEWWLHYPRRVAKPAAFKAYKAALVRGANPGDMIALADYYAEAWTKQRLSDGDYRMYPATWLNQCMYDSGPGDFYETGLKPVEVKELWE